MTQYKNNLKLKDNLNLNLKNIWLNTLILCLIAYFCFHSLSGQRGFIAYLKLNKELKNKQFELNILTKKRQYLENKVKLLYPKSVDLDLIDEIARRDMGLISEGENLIILARPKAE